ncbi:duboraya isoform X2 [Triplophysa dalaica]|uniref:duboraya isoform X2 n=2 Tax=Triplophysa dalaica TaxID=1582913 RepID=UPI0024DF4555|nr:duboraya isoform X2 [Triplophysa dalaica]
MEDHTVVKKRSVAELAGKFSCQIPQMTDAEVNKPVRRRPPRTLHLSASNNADQSQDEKEAGPVSPRKNRNSALIEKLQANLTLSPTGPPLFPKSPGAVKLPLASFFPTTPGSPVSPPAIATPKQEETATSFENPVEGGVLKSINKGRARLSIKRRPPSRKNRKSSTEEGEEVALTPNGHEGEVFEDQKASDCVDTISVSSKQQTEQETESTDVENQHPKEAEPENKVETVNAENKDGGEQEHKTEEVEEKREGELQLGGSSSESKEQEGECEEPVAQAHEKPQTEPESTTDETETEQKEEVEINL